MKREILERLTTTLGDLQLQRRGNHYEIIMNGVFLMASYNGDSERAMVHEAVRVLGWEPETVIVAGLGMGFTLAGVLSYPGVRRVRVYEVAQAIVDWNRGCLRHLNGGCLDDPRVEVTVGDFVDSMEGNSGWNMICVDLDNGPEWTALSTNDRLYTIEGFTQLRGCLTEPGVCSLWCPSPSRRLEGLLSSTFDGVKEFHSEASIYVGLAN